MSNAALPQLPEPQIQRQLPTEQLVSIIVQQQRLIEQLTIEVNRLKVSQNLDSQTSSKPPSTDLLKKPEKAKEQPETQGEASKRRPGGQPGHAGKTRKGFGRVDRYEILRPQSCPDCGSQEFGQQPVAVQVQQVAQLVEKPIEIVEYQRHTCECVNCGQTSSAPWPETIVPGQDLGVNLQGLLGWLGNHGHLPYEKQQELLQEIGQIEIGVGTLQATNSRLAEAIEPSISELKQWVKQQSHVHVDESPWPVLGLKEWMWVMAGEQFCIFHAGDTRSRAELVAQLGESFAGVLSSDDFSVYNGYPVAAQQKCLAHLRRHFEKVVKWGHGSAPALGQEFLDLIDEAFAKYGWWRETGNEDGYREWADSFKSRVESSLRRWSSKAGYEAGKLLQSLREKAEQWWYFLDHPEVPPDNNLAERAMRLAVTKRKVSGSDELTQNWPAVSQPLVTPTDNLNTRLANFEQVLCRGGSRSMDRFAQTADLLSVVQTCRRQGRLVISR